jgi:putative FmdB family regulatory protein
MPIYEYACSDCDHKLEALQKMNDLPLEQCPACGQKTLKKLVSAAAFHLKGTGWYETDFKGSKKTEEKEKSEKKTEKKTEEKTDKKTETPSSTSSSDTSASPAKA